MVYIGYLIILDGQGVKKSHSENSIAFGKSTSHGIFPKEHTPKIVKKRHKYGLKHALHTLDGHFR